MKGLLLACVNGGSKRSPPVGRWRCDAGGRSTVLNAQGRHGGSLVENLRFSHSFGFVPFLSSFLQRNGLHFRIRLWPRLVLRFPQRWNRIVASSRFFHLSFLYLCDFSSLFSLSAPDLLKRLFFGISQLWCAYFFPLLCLSAAVLFIFLFFFFDLPKGPIYSFWFPVFSLVTWSILDQASSPSGLAWPFAGHLFFLLAIFRRVLLEFSWCVL